MRSLIRFSASMQEELLKRTNFSRNFYGSSQLVILSTSLMHFIINYLSLNKCVDRRFNRRPRPVVHTRPRRHHSEYWQVPDRVRIERRSESHVFVVCKNKRDKELNNYLSTQKDTQHEQYSAFGKSGEPDAMVLQILSRQK